ncbi:serine carboxypeptidase S28 [Lasiosphaeria miniovina]|uniref:Serine carboxypeptidase S28 n=1 Tax=Lasiosphaeria miniovina TaxID=1954250 RepID=A0AA40DZ16_9PEZI|nr:serine carboxypeptidase S28 [Lasiosphaeria miniovina]KAK0716778.1 serine carboxypeptidase S28 [Lasiosphaeria miniovina]
MQRLLGDLAEVGGSSGNSTFRQLIDHKNPSLGTFSQRIWWNNTFWAGPGSPIVLFTPGESDATNYGGYITERTLTGLYARAIGGAVVMVEHRYYGESSPFQVLDTQNLTYLTLENSIADLVNIARNVKLPFDNSSLVNAPNSPWINVGGSYSGALAAWTEKLSPGTFWAYHASSAPVQLVDDYWSYFLPIQKGMPKNCSTDISRIVEHVDNVLDSKNETAICDLKKRFGLDELGHADDFATAVSNTVSMWQSVQFFSNYSAFFQMCDSMEGVRPVQINGTNVSNSTGKWLNTTVPAIGVGLKKALTNYASWFRNEYVPNVCTDNDGNLQSVNDCFDTYNTSQAFYADWTVGNGWNRQWMWFLCNEPFSYWQTGAPKNHTTIVSRYVSVEYYQRQCALSFPTEGNATYGSAAGKTVDMTNDVTQGWDLTNTTRLLWVNGEFDPWRSASVSSELRPGGPLESTAAAPVFLMPGARHCNDLLTKTADINEGVRATQRAVIAQMEVWAQDFYKGKNCQKWMICDRNDGWGY